MPDKPIYQPWSEEAFASDFDVQALTPMQRWMYRTLLQKAFICSTRPFPPNDDSILWKMSGCPSSTVWNQHKEPVKAMFEPRIVNGVPVLFRQRLADDWSRLQSIRDAKRESANERWRRERQAVHPHASALRLYADAMQVSEVSNRNKTKDKGVQPPRPQAFDPEIKKLQLQAEILGRTERLRGHTSIANETKAGVGPECPPAAVRPEVLERIRMREAARGKR